MTIHDAELTGALGELDPARGEAPGTQAPLTPSEARRAAAGLEHIVATDPGAPWPSSTPAPGPARRRHQRRWTWAATGVLVTAAAVVVPVLTLGGPKAYATWSPVPVPLSAAESVTATRACLETLKQVADPQGEPLLAERRGGWTYVLVRLGADVESSCIMPTSEITEPPAGDRRRWFANTGEGPSEPTPRRDEVRVLGAAVGSTKEGLFSYTEGQVGRDVTDLTFTTPRGVTVQASVASGRFAVWWPAGSSDLDSPEISQAPDIDVTLDDGTTRRLPR